MSIVPATAADAGDIRGLLEASALPTADLTLELSRNFLLERDGPNLVSVGGLEPVGGDALLRSLAVAPSQQGRGAGRRMVEALEARPG